MSNIIRIPPLQRPIAKPIPYPFPRHIRLDKSCVLALLPGGQKSASWQDESGKDNDGVVTGASLTSKGRHGPSHHLDEIDDHIVVSDFSYGPYFTICIWMKLDDNAGSLYQYFFSHGIFNTLNSINLYVNEDGLTNPNRLQIKIRNSVDATSNLIFDNFADTDWHLVCVTVDASSSRLYVDGDEKASDVTSDNSFNPATDIYIGAREDLDVNRHFGGLIDGVLIFKRALSATEILNIYNQGI